MKTLNLDYRMERGNGYGSYHIVFNHNGKEVKIHTTDSEAFDWWNDDSDIERQEEAKQHCEMKIEQYLEWN